MQASDEIFSLWFNADGIYDTFVNVYGDAIAAERYHETMDAYGRRDAARIVKSMQQLWEDAPDLPAIHTWPHWHVVCEIAEHIFDEDYPSRKRTMMGKRDPNINMYSEAVAPDDNIQDGGEAAPDVTFDDLSSLDDIGDEVPDEPDSNT
jgi:hypothetical protein